MSSGYDERRVLAAMIRSKSVLAAVVSKWDGNLFASPASNIIGGFCVQHYRQYAEAPQTKIHDYARSWASTGRQEKAMVLAIFELLQTIDSEPSSQTDNPQYWLDLAGKHFRLVSLGRLATALEQAVSAGDVRTAEDLRRSWPDLSLGQQGVTDLLSDKEAFALALDMPRGDQVMIDFGGPLGQFMAGQFERDSFISYLAPEKGGKSSWLMDHAYRAARQRRRTLYVVVGDMSQNQVLRRFAALVAGHPVKPGVVRFPTSLEPGPPDLGPQVTFEERYFDEGVDESAFWGTVEEIKNFEIRSARSHLRLATYPSLSATVDTIRANMMNLAENDWPPDVLILDYADNLAFPPGTKDKRDGINTVWAKLRAISQEFHACVVTATQADAKSYEKELLGRQNFSESKQKYAHVTGFLGINQTRAEKQKGVVRLNWLEARDIPTSETEVVWVAGAPGVWRPIVKSAL